MLTMATVTAETEDPVMSTMTLKEMNQTLDQAYNNMHAGATLEDCEVFLYIAASVYMFSVDAAFLKLTHIASVCRIAGERSVCNKHHSVLAILLINDQLFIHFYLSLAHGGLRYRAEPDISSLSFTIALFLLALASFVSFGSILWLVVSREQHSMTRALCCACKHTAMWLALKSILLAVPATVYLVKKRSETVATGSRTPRRIMDLPLPASGSVYVKRLFVKFWDPTNKDNNLCPTCQSNFLHPQDAITSQCSPEPQKNVFILEPHHMSSASAALPDYMDTCVTQCGHCFHYDCLRQSLDRNGLCPICRTETNMRICFIIARQPVEEVTV